MKTTVRHRSMAALVATAIKRVMRSQRVAEKCMVGSFVFLVAAATSESLLLVFGAIALFAGAVRHYKNVEQDKR